MAAIHLVFFLLAGQADLLGIDDDDVIAGVEEGSVDRFVFAHQHHSRFAGEPAEDNILRVQNDTSYAGCRSWTGMRYS